jgi:hypothetical protein
MARSISGNSRSILGVIALVLVYAALGWRIHALRTPERIALGPRSAEMARIQRVAGRVTRYALQYGRPVYRWDLGRHVTQAESTSVEALRADLYDDGLNFAWDDSVFTIESRQYYRVEQNFEWPKGVPEYARARLIALAPR